jgi:hypothetical protein
MFRRCSDDEFDERSSAGTRPLFRVGSFVFQDTMDGEGGLHHMVIEKDDEAAAYEMDQPTMYEMVARYLAGEYEKEAYELEHSPAHHALLDLLEMAAARARSGECEFTIADLDGSSEDIEDFGDEDELDDREEDD